MDARAYNQRVLAMSLAQKQALATRFYRKNWNRLYSAPLGAQGQPTPNLVFGNPSTGTAVDTEANPQGNREIVIGRRLMKAMILKNKDYRRGARSTLAHETAHVYQNPELFSQGRDLPWDQQPTEAGANQFADAITAPGMRRAKIRRAKKLGNTKRARQLRARPLPTYDPGQFSSNYGADPTGIRWPG